MGRYTGPKSKISRRFGEPIFGPDKVLERRPNPPGVHGGKRRRKVSDYGSQLREKQKAKFIYGMREEQFHRFYETARSKQGNTGDILLQMCESRLDNLVFRLGLAPTRPAARQLVSHRHVELDGKVVNIPSVQVKPGQHIGIRERDRNMKVVIETLMHPTNGPYDWLSFDEPSKTGVYLRLPEPAEVPESIDVQSIVELYSR